MAAELALGGVTYLANCAFKPASESPRARAVWLQSVARRLLRIFCHEVSVSGPVPESGLLVSNHLSYVDVLVLASLTPAVFVAKREVRGWPVFGWFARLGGTMFIHRERRTHVSVINAEVQAVLGRGLLVIVFPEGTSSGGQTVLPFKSSLLEPAVRQPHPLWACAVGYELVDGDVSEEVCYWKDMTFAPHLVNLFGKRSLRAKVKFARVQNGGEDRKQLARRLHAEVLRLKGAARTTKQAIHG